MNMSVVDLNNMA